MAKAFAASRRPDLDEPRGLDGDDLLSKGPDDYASAKRSDTKRYATRFHGMLSAGSTYIAAVPVRRRLVSCAHNEAGPPTGRSPPPPGSSQPF